MRVLRGQSRIPRNIVNANEVKLITKAKGKMFQKRRIGLDAKPRLDSTVNLPIQM
jgi:hypothetical protein